MINELVQVMRFSTWHFLDLSHNAFWGIVLTVGCMLLATGCVFNEAVKIVHVVILFCVLAMQDS